jgi:hypothetical protein
MRSRVAAGIVAGLMAGVVFGFLMHGISVPSSMGGRMPMIRMMAAVVRSNSLLAGWAYLLASSVAMGGIFGFALGNRATSLGKGLAWGVVYGVLVWLVGALVVMPVLVGMEALSPISMPALRPSTWASLGAHVIAGLVLGGSFARLWRRA